MSQSLSGQGSEGNGVWLPLTEYSVRSGISLSTIRRKIKSNTIPYRLERGRYLILFNGPSQTDAPVTAKPVVEVSELVNWDSEPSEPKPAPLSQRVTADSSDDAIRMVSEAFELALQEKEERLRLMERRNQELEERLNELRLLVRVLEEKYEVRY